MDDWTDVGQSAEIDTGDFATLIGSISFFLTVVSQVAPFVDSRLGVPEWVALSGFGQKDAVALARFERTLGTPGKRAKEIMNSLVRNKLALMEMSEGSVTIRITDDGRAKFDEVSLQLERLLSQSLRGMEHSPVALSKGMNVLARSLQSRASWKEGKRKEAKKMRKSTAGSSEA